MIKLVIPESYSKEREYIIKTLLETFLGLDINISYDSQEIDYLLELPNNAQIVIKDSFFSNFSKKDTYLHENNIPNKINYVKNSFILEDDIPIIYGNEILDIKQDKIVCGIDIFASAFFMLTRWEEYVVKKRDKHNRFPDKLSLAYKNNFHKRPIVNEYIEMLWNMIHSLDNSLQRKEKKYSVYITHDVDNIRRYDTLKKYIKALAGDLILRKNPLLWLSTTSDYILYKLGLKKDTHDTFDFLMDISEKYNLKSHFYFMPNKLGEADARYNIDNPIVAKTIKAIKEREHIVGIHGSYNGYNKADIFKTELNRLNKFNQKTTEGRQHYLCFENPTTWQLWEDNNLQIDSTIGYSHFAGFRAGTCFEFPVFNILTRSTLRLIEKPLIAMEGAVKEEYNNLDNFISEIYSLSQLTKKYNGTFVFLWHNNNINVKEWKNYSKEYEQIIEKIQ